MKEIKKCFYCEKEIDVNCAFVSWYLQPREEYNQSHLDCHLKQNEPEDFGDYCQHIDNYEDFKITLNREEDGDHWYLDSITNGKTELAGELGYPSYEHYFHGVDRAISYIQKFLSSEKV